MSLQRTNAAFLRGRFPGGHQPFTHPQGGMLSVAALKFVDSLSDLITYGPVIQDTHAARINQLPATPATNPALYPASKFLSYQFLETDRSVLYLSQIASGTVNTSGTAVTWVSGNLFNSAWVGFPIWINGVQYKVSAVGSTTGLTLSTSAGTQSGASFARSIADWIYIAGEWSGTQANLPNDLVGSDVGFIANVTDYGHRLRWTGSAWNWAPGESGSGFLQLFEVDPTGNGWHLYDGSTINYLKSDGTLGSITLPNLTGASGDAAFLVAGSPNSAVNPATAPTISGKTDTDTTGVTVPANTGVESANISFNYASGGNAASAAADTHVHSEGPVTDPGHFHTLSAANAPISATGEPQNLIRRPWFRQ